MSLSARQLIITLLFVFLTTSPSFAQSTSITYQGQLRQGGTPYSGMADLEFRLFDQLVGGIQVGPTVSRSGVPVEDGLFQVDLDFGSDAFTSQDRYLEIRIGGTPLNPRQAVRPAPTALFALSGNEGPMGPEGASPFTLNTTTGAIEYLHNDQVFRFEPNGVSSYGPRLTAGHAHNQATGFGAVVAGGGGATIPNIASGMWSAISGGISNTASHTRTSIGGGELNSATGSHSTIGGGFSNTASATRASVGGGGQNTASRSEAVIAGGFDNTASGLASSVGGGASNCAGGAFSTAHGNRAKVRPGSNSGDPGVGCAGIPQTGTNGDTGTYIWADSTNADFVSTGSNQFLVRASGGMGLNTNAPTATLSIRGPDVSASGPEIHLSGNGFDQVHSGRIRFREGTALNNYRGAFIHFDGASNLFHLGVHNTNTIDSADDFNVITIRRNLNLAGIGRVPAANRLEVEGDASKTTAGSWLANSDGRIKSSVEPVSGALEKVLALNPVSFQYSSDYRSAHPGITDRRYYNVIAQEFAEVFPEAVKGSGEYLPGHEICAESGSTAECADHEILQVDTYPALITALAAIKELAKENRRLNDEVAALRTESDQVAKLATRLADLESALNATNRLAAGGQP